MTKSQTLKAIGLSTLLIVPTIAASGQDTKRKVSGKAPEVQVLADTLRSLKYVLVNVIQDRHAKTRTTKDRKPDITIQVTVVAKEVEDTPDFHEPHDTVITCMSGTDEGQRDCESIAMQLSEAGYSCTSEKEGGKQGNRCESL